MNEETEDATRTPGSAAVIATIILVGIYVIVSIAAQAFHGPQFLVDNSDDVLSALGTDVLGSPWDKLLIIAVLTSASASTQTTILPTSRTSLSMAVHGAIPKYFGRIHPRFLTPGPSTIWMGVVSIVWYVGLTIVSENILFDSIAALGLMIAFYYGLTGLRLRRLLPAGCSKSVRNFLLAGVAPLIGGLMLACIFVKSCIDLSEAGELRIRRLLVRARAAARDRDRLPDHGDRVHAALLVELAASSSGGSSRPPTRRWCSMADPIVLGYDESPSANAALAATIRIAPVVGAKVVVVFGYYISPLGGLQHGSIRARRSRTSGDTRSGAPSPTSRLPASRSSRGSSPASRRTC